MKTHFFLNNVPIFPRIAHLQSHGVLTVGQLLLIPYQGK